MSHQALGEQFGRIVERVKTPDRGATVSTQTGHEPQQGWAYAIAGHEHLEPSQSFGEASVGRYVGGKARELGKPGAHLGLWHQPGVGVYHDVSHVVPGSYAGGAEAIAKGHQHGQVSVYNIGKEQTLYMHPATHSQGRQTRSAVAGIRRQRPTPGQKVADMSTSQLGAALRGRHQV